MKLIGLAGQAGCGKDTIARWVRPQIEGSCYAFAKPIKDAYESIFGVDPESLTREEKEAPIPGFDFSPRRAMQTLGTEWGRALNKNLWISLAEKEYQERKRLACSRAMIVTDVRFENEARWVLDHGGLVVNISRPGLAPVEAHSSEAGIPFELIGYHLNNNGELRHLRGAVTKLAEYINKMGVRV